MDEAGTKREPVMCTACIVQQICSAVKFSVLRVTFSNFKYFTSRFSIVYSAAGATPHASTSMVAPFGKHK